MRSFSIKRRIVAAVVATELALVACLLLLSASVMRSHAIRSFDTALRGRALSVAALVRYSESSHPDLIFDRTHLPREATEGTPDLFHIETEDGRVLATSQHSDSDWMSGRKGEVWEFSFRGEPYRGLRLGGVPVLDSEEEAPEVPETLQVVYAGSTQMMKSSLSRAFLGILIGGALLLAISVYASVRVIEKGLFPLTQLAQSAGAISTENWSLQVPDSAASVAEIAPLASALSKMVNRLHATFQQQRDFTSNAAHELRTPVAVLKSTLQSLLQESRSGEVYQSGISDALADLARLEMLLHSMLRLARADQHSQTVCPKHPRVDIVATCEAAVARLAPLGRSRGATISLKAPSEPLHVCAEPEDLEIVWANLIENAIRHGPPDSEIEMIAERQSSFVSVCVVDKGNGIPSADIPKMFDRFYKGDQSRSRQSGGYGLGLAIAKAFVEGYGGSISATSLEPRGTRIGVQLPIND